MPGYTRLDAVNRMLMASGEQPVNTLLSDGTNDVSLAEAILDDSIIEILSRGWSFNTEVQKFYRDSNNKITLSENILHFTPWGEYQDYRLVQRGDYLYDPVNNRDTFPDDEYVELKVIYKLEYDEIPTEIQFYIADHAARNYQMKTQRSREMDAYLAEQLLLSQAKAIAADARNRNTNYNKNYNANTYWQTQRNRYGFRGPI